MIFNPLSRFTFNKLAAYIAVVVASSYSISTMAIKPLTGTVTTDESGDAFTSSQLLVTSGGIVGQQGTQSEVNNGTLEVTDGGIVLGGLRLNGTTAKMGESGTAEVKLGGSQGFDILEITGGSNLLLDNAKVTGPASGIKITGGTLTTTKNTLIDTRGARLINSGIVDGISLSDHESGRDAIADISGSTIYADEAGIALDCAGDALCKVITRDANVQGGRTGILQSGSTLEVHGGRITGTGTDTLGLEGTGSGILVFANSLGSSTTIDQGAVVTGNSGAGLQVYGEDFDLSPSKIDTVNISSGSTVQGTNGISIDASNGAVTDEHHVEININDSLIDGVDGAAIKSTSGLTDINISGESTLKSSTGVLLETGSGATTNMTLSGVKESVNGDIVNNGGVSNVSLLRSTLAGKLQEVSSLSVGPDSLWNMTGNSSVDSVLNAGNIQLSGNNAARNTLTVNDNYTGNGGSLRLNTKLGDDQSETDKVIINGNATGTTYVAVNNVGGTGAQTVNGIEVIKVSGTSAADAFKQEGRIVAGAYDYHLLMKNNSWYLSSNITDDNNINFNPLIRPEAGSYIANIASANQMFLTRLHDRLGETRYIDPVTGKEAVTSLWLRQVGSHNKFREGSGQLETQSNTYVAQLGGDIAQWSTSLEDRWHLGLMAGYGNSHSNTHSTYTGYGSEGSVTGYSVGVYGTWFANEAERTGSYLDSQLQYAWFNNHVGGDSSINESYKSQGFIASVEYGYTFLAGKSGSESNPSLYFLEPNIQATWMGVEADSLAEQNGTKVSSGGDGNIQTRLGMRAFIKGHNKIDNGKDRDFQPFVELNWVHNTDRFAVTMNDATIEQAGAVNLIEAKLGVEGQMSKRLQLWGNVGQQVGGQGYSNSTAMIGIRYSF